MRAALQEIDHRRFLIRRTYGRRVRRAAVIGLMTLIAGCGRPPAGVAPVTGRVTFDGKPISLAAVMFVPVAGGRPASGVTDHNGDYQLTTFKPGDGALLGEHRVTVTKFQTSGVRADDHGLAGPMEPGAQKSQWIVPERYSNSDQSSLTALVVTGGVRYDIALVGAAP